MFKSSDFNDKAVCNHNFSCLRARGFEKNMFRISSVESNYSSHLIPEELGGHKANSVVTNSIYLSNLSRVL